VRWWHLVLLGHLLPQKGNCETILNYFLLCVMFWVPCSFKIRIAILKGRDFMEDIAINGNDNIEMCFEEVVLEYVDCISLALNEDQ